MGILGLGGTYTSSWVDGRNEEGFLYDGETNFVILLFFFNAFDDGELMFGAANDSPQPPSPRIILHFWSDRATVAPEAMEVMPSATGPEEDRFALARCFQLPIHPVRSLRSLSCASLDNRYRCRLYLPGETKDGDRLDLELGRTMSDEYKIRLRLPRGRRWHHGGGRVEVAICLPRLHMREGQG